MATLELPIGGLVPDSSGDCFYSTAEVECTLATNTNMYQEVLVFDFPTGSDIEAYGKFVVPQNYVGTPVLAVRGINNAGNGSLVMGAKIAPAMDDNESFDQAYETDDLGSAVTISGYSDEDLIEIPITLTPAAAYTAGDVVPFILFRDDGTDTSSAGSFAITDVAFRYSDT